MEAIKNINSETNPYKELVSILKIKWKISSKKFLLPQCIWIVNQFTKYTLFATSSGIIITFIYLVCHIFI